MIQKQATPEMRKIVKELSELRALQKESDIREVELTTKIKEYVNNGAGSIKDNSTLLALVKEKVRTGIDTHLLKANYPEAAAECAKTSFYLQVECC